MGAHRLGVSISRPFRLRFFGYVVGYIDYLISFLKSIYRVGCRTTYLIIYGLRLALHLSCKSLRKSPAKSQFLPNLSM